jgi:hypothetical protein
MQRSMYCWTITMQTVFSMWSVPRCYKQDSLKRRVSCCQSCQQLSWVKWREAAGSWVREFSCQLLVVIWKSACEEKTRRLLWNGCQPGAQLVSWQEFSMGGCDKRTWVREAEESPLCYICCQETASGYYNRLRTLVCVRQWSVKCSSEWCT